MTGYATAESMDWVISLVELVELVELAVVMVLVGCVGMFVVRYASSINESGENLRISK